MENKTKNIHCEMFKHYGGDVDRKEFGDLLMLMTIYLGDAYICGMGDREVAWKRFVDAVEFKLKCTPGRARQEAHMVFIAVDCVAAYS